METEKLLSIYKNFVTEELKLAKLISEMDKEENYDGIPGIKGYSSAVQYHDYIKITVNKIPEKVALFKEVGTHYYGAAKEFWLGSVMYALNELNPKPFNGKCVVYIKVYYKDKTWDVDNHHVSFIINAIRYSGIIDDDNHTKLCYMVGGEIAENEDFHTDIYICNEKYFPTLFTSI